MKRKTNRLYSFIIRTRHLQRTGHMKLFVLVSEEAISKGIRRIVALTGPEALKAEKKCNALEERVENIQNLVEQKMKEGGLKIKETSQEISRIGEVSSFFSFCIVTNINSSVAISFRQWTGVVLFLLLLGYFRCRYLCLA